MGIKRSVRVACAKRGTTQRELAVGINTTEQAVSRWCSSEGNPSYSTLKRIAEFFEMKLTEFLEPEDNKHSEERK